MYNLVLFFEGEKMPKISKVLKGMPAYLEQVKGIKLGETPIDYLMINVPPLCNYRCKKCFTSASSRKIKNI